MCRGSVEPSVMFKGPKVGNLVLFFWQYWACRQVLYQLSHSASPFLCWIFSR
jgi:hypothetical protein